ncbi:MAG: hypothetical protein VX947_03960 [Chloroflexota bacterium]|nr:hypothetical protein [Chloroflexota bacterium]
MPSSVQRVFCLGLRSYLKDSLFLDTVLREIDSVATESYWRLLKNSPLGI